MLGPTSSAKSDACIFGAARCAAAAAAVSRAQGCASSLTRSSVWSRLVKCVARRRLVQSCAVSCAR